MLNVKVVPRLWDTKLKTLKISYLSFFLIWTLKTPELDSFSRFYPVNVVPKTRGTTDAFNNVWRGSYAKSLGYATDFNSQNTPNLTTFHFDQLVLCSKDSAQQTYLKIFDVKVVLSSDEDFDVKTPKFWQLMFSPDLNSENMQNLPSCPVFIQSVSSPKCSAQQTH